MCSDLEAVKLLVDNGVDLNVVGDSGTVLTLAAVLGRGRIADFLLSKRASKEKAIHSALDGDKDLVKSFFVEQERVAQFKAGSQEKREWLVAICQSSIKPEEMPVTCKGITIEGLRKLKSVIQVECEREDS